MNPPLVPTNLLELDAFCRRTGLHPELVRRFVALGLIDPADQGDGELWFSVAQVRRTVRTQRLRNELSLNYNALGLVLDLLDRIEQLERGSRSVHPIVTRSTVSQAKPPQEN